METACKHKSDVLTNVVFLEDELPAFDPAFFNSADQSFYFLRFKREIVAKMVD